MASPPRSDADQWRPELYDGKHSFVWKLASSVVELLAPQPGERILDMGSGTGQLTSEIAKSGAQVVGLDHSPAMVKQARQQYPQIEFHLADAHDLDLGDSFDAVFSNAALHWIQDPVKVVSCIARALKPRGRMAVEFGGAGNICFLSRAITQASGTVLEEPLPHPWYFPDIVEFGEVLKQHGLEVTQGSLIDRPTPLDGYDGLRNWVRMFGGHWLTRIPAPRHDEFFTHIEEIARPNLFHDAVWHADYRRIRVLSRKTTRV